MDSLINQTLKEIEIICVDDGSTDNSGKILDEYAKKDTRIKVIHQKNLGVSKARNAGLKISKGKYITFVDSDDYLDVLTFDKVYEYAKRDNIDILKFGIRYFKDGNDNYVNNVDCSDSKVISSKEYIYDSKNIKNYVCSTLFKYEVIKNENIEFIEDLKYQKDFCFLAMALKNANKIKLIPGKFYHYRREREGSSITTAKKEKLDRLYIGIYQHEGLKKICDYWRKQNGLKNKESELLTLILDKLIRSNVSNKPYAQELIESIGSDIYNKENLEKCPEYIKNYMKKIKKINIKNIETKSNPKVSVIIPVYNTEQYLRQCIDSIVNQTLKDIEIICVNDGSTDNSLNILKEYANKDPRIKIIDQKNKGAGSARNEAIKLARGDYLVFVDSDDYAKPDYLKLMYEKILKDNADICICDANRKSETKNKCSKYKVLLVSHLIPNKVFSHKDIPENFFQITTSAPWNKMIKRELVTKNKLYFQETKVFNDYFFIYACLAKADRITTINKVLYSNRRDHGNNLQSSINRSPYCCFDVNSKLYEWLIDQNIYDVLEISFSKLFIQNARWTLLNCKKNKDIYINIFNRIKHECNKYQMFKNINKFSDEFKMKAKIFLYGTPEEYEKSISKNIFKNQKTKLINNKTNNSNLKAA